MTNSHLIRDGAVMISAKYSWSKSPRHVLERNTVIDGGQRCHIGCADSPAAFNPSRIARDLLTCCSPSLKGDVELVAYLIVGHATGTDAAGLGQGFKTGSC